MQQINFNILEQGISTLCYLIVHRGKKQHLDILIVKIQMRI